MINTFRVMDREEALRRLPEAHARALCLRGQGLSDEALGEALEIPPAAVGPLLAIADAKLARLLSDASSQPDSFSS